MNNKKKLALWLASYTLLFGGLLFLQYQTINGILNRMAAAVLTLFLMIPTWILFKLYIRLKEKLEKEEKEKSSEGNFFQTEELEEKYYEFAKNAGLSKREQEAGWLIYKGLTNQQIAEELFISETTVKKHASHIYEKLEVSGRKELKKKVSEEILFLDKSQESTYDNRRSI